MYIFFVSVIELKKCIGNIREFKLTDNPHECKLGVWYDNFKTDNNIIKYQINKLDEPHKKLHGMLQEAIECEQICDKCERDECLQVRLKNNLDKIEKNILDILDNTKEVFKHHYEEIVIKINVLDMCIGIVVDKVLGIENLNCAYDSDNYNSICKSKFILGTATSNKSEDLILLFNDKVLTNIIQSIDIEII